MSRVLLLIFVVAIYYVTDSLNAIATDYNEDEDEPEERGCCVPKGKIWESSKDLWESDVQHCNAAEEFQVRQACIYSVTYDRKWEMFSLTSIDSNEKVKNILKCEQDGIDKAKCSMEPMTRTLALSTKIWFLTIRRKYMSLYPSAPQSNHNCLYYAGNDDKPTCHNITNAESITKNFDCVYVFDPVSKKFRFADRTCPKVEKQNLIDLYALSRKSEICLRYEHSWEYTCVGNSMGTRYKGILDKENGCCVYKNKVWESDKHVWESDTTSCSAPGEFQNRQGCFYSVTYDRQREMFSIISIDPKEIVFGNFECQKEEHEADSRSKFAPEVAKSVQLMRDVKAECSERPTPRSNVTSANDAFRQIRRSYTRMIVSATGASIARWNCPYYAGNDEKPTCHNVTYGEGVMRKDMCIYIYDPATAKFRFADRLCPGKQADTRYQTAIFVTTVPDNKCYRDGNSWEYTCIARQPINIITYMEILKRSNLPLTPAGCCSFKPGQDCKNDSWTRVQPNNNISCHYKVQKLSEDDPVTVVSMSTQIGVHPGTKCSLVEKTSQLYNCQCPALTLQHPSTCLKDISNLITEMIHLETSTEAQPPKFCCNYANILSTEISTISSECGSESWIQVESHDDCHYVLEKKSPTEPTKVLTQIFPKVKFESSIGCVRSEKIVGQYNCHCRASATRYSSGCLKVMFDMVDGIL